MGNPVALVWVESAAQRTKIDAAKDRYDAAKKVAFDLQSGINYFCGIKHSEDGELLKFLQERCDQAEVLAHTLYAEYVALFPSDVQEMLKANA